MELKHIKTADLVGHKVSELADTPAISSQALKERFDSLSTDVIIPAFNELADQLEETDIDKKVASDDITNIKLDADNNIVISKDGGVTYRQTNSAGHIIQDSDDTDYPARTRMQFSENVDIVDDFRNNKTHINIPKVPVIQNGANVNFPYRETVQFSNNVVITDNQYTNKTFISVPAGEKGDQGDTATIHVGTVEAVDVGEEYVENVGSDTDGIFNFGIPKGNKGDAATIIVGTVQTGASASVSNSGTVNNAVFDFILPKGDKGDPGTGLTILDVYATIEELEEAHPTGQRGDAYIVGNAEENTVYLWSTVYHTWEDVGALKGAKGDTGATPTVTVGTVVESETPYVENVGTSTEAVFNFGLQKGDKGDTGNAATIAVGTVSSAAQGQNPSVTNSGTTTNAVFDFVLPKGDRGEPAVVNGKTGDEIEIYSYDIELTPIDSTTLQDVATPVKTTTTSPIATTNGHITSLKVVGKSVKSGSEIISASGDLQTHNSDNTKTSTTHTNRPLYSVGTVKNELIVNADGSGQFVQRVASCALSSLTFSYNSTYTFFEATVSDMLVSDTYTPCLFSDYAFGGRGTTTVVKSGDDKKAYTFNSKIRIKDTTIETTSKPSGTFLYELATPTTTTLTSSEVADILSLLTFDGQTYFDADGAEYEVGYFANTKVGQSVANVDAKVDDLHSELIESNAELQEEIDSKIADFSKVVCPNWNSTTLYNVGDYVLYNSTLWKCLVSNTGTTPAEGATWTETSLGKSVADGKTLVANAISAKGVETAADSSFETLAENIGEIVTDVQHTVRGYLTKTGQSGGGGSPVVSYYKSALVIDGVTVAYSNFEILNGTASTYDVSRQV